MGTTMICLANLDNPQHAQGIVDCLNHYAADPMGCGCALSAEVRANLIDAMKQHGGMITLLALAGEEVVGVAVCIRSFSTFYAQPRLNLHDLVVKSVHRGQGVGRKLLESVVAYAKENGYCAVSLEVRQDNPRAQTLYRSQGFADCASPMAFWVRPVGAR